MPNEISEVTRRKIADRLLLENVAWAGRLEEDDFLSRLYNLDDLPSFDGRYRTARGDISKHRVLNLDWEDDWVFSDSRFDLLHSGDDEFLRFLAETVHPLVRSDPNETRTLISLYNEYLQADGWELKQIQEISGHPVFGPGRVTARAPGTLRPAEGESPAQEISTDLGPPVHVEELVMTLSELLEHQGEEELSRVLRTSKPALVLQTHDNWNGGTDLYSLDLRIPVRDFAGIAPTQAEIEKKLHERLQAVFRGHEGFGITEARLIPDRRLVVDAGPGLISPEVLERIWGLAALRIFISHSSAQKDEAALLKNQLSTWGAGAFVAHEDITPSQLWETEILRALASMDAMVLLATTDSRPSLWCNQELGFALARGVPVLPVRMTADPPGFVGKIQAFPSSGLAGGALAEQLLDHLLASSSTGARARETLVRAIVHSGSFNQSNRVSAKLQTLSGWQEDQLRRLEEATEQNGQVTGAWDAPGRIRALSKRERRARTAGTER